MPNNDVSPRKSIVVREAIASIYTRFVQDLEIAYEYTVAFYTVRSPKYLSLSENPRQINGRAGVGADMCVCLRNIPACLVAQFDETEI